MVFQRRVELAVGGVRLVLKRNSLSLDTWMFVLLVGGWSLALAVRLAEPYSSVVVMLLGLSAIALYLIVRHTLARLVLVYAAIAAIAIAPMVLAIYLRHTIAPYEFAHDGLIQTEEAIKFLLAGKNPYVENFASTPLAQWHFAEPGVTRNPALDHVAYLPFLFLFSTPVYVVAQMTIGWFDERFVFLPLFAAMLLLLPRLTPVRTRSLALLLAVGLNPLFVPFLAEGRNDVFVLFWVVLSVILLQMRQRILSVIALALACATKTTAWFILPFYAIYFCTLCMTKSTKVDLRVTDENGFRLMLPRIHSLVAPLVVFAGILGAIILPFFFWNAAAFVDDLFHYTAGSTESAYPIKSLGLGGIALAWGWIPSNASYFPFTFLQLLFGLPTLAVLCRWQMARNTLGRVWLCYGMLTLVIAFFSRVFNDNHLGYILTLLALGTLTEPNTVPWYRFPIALLVPLLYNTSDPERNGYTQRR
jgi:hypothetical protein